MIDHAFGIAATALLALYMGVRAWLWWRVVAGYLSTLHRGGS